MLHRLWLPEGLGAAEKQSVSTPSASNEVTSTETSPSTSAQILAICSSKSAFSYFSNERRICCYAVDQTHFVGFFDFL